ncbi:MAG: hypothetical protein CMN55_08345 [Sneathiella sp.]|nr:hypothetical protein [Sneathiella sp.]
MDISKRLRIVSTLIEQLKALSATYVLIENEYIDRDFSASFSEFYSTVFKRHNKFCRRMHFFKSDLGKIFAQHDSPEIISRSIQTAADNGEYLGFVVVRPIAHAPIGSAVIKFSHLHANLVAHLLVKARYEVHLLGATLSVDGIPLTQQDSRVGSCAQASIWMAGRHFHTRHRGKWFSTVDITKAATQLGEFGLSRALPAGSEFLGVNNMVQALRALDQEPLTYAALDKKGNWGPLRPYDVINRYVDSGIPVILGLRNSGTIGHAVVVTGHVIKKVDEKVKLPKEPTRAELCEAFLVNDDQRGGNLLMPIEGSSKYGETEYSVLKDIEYIIVPLPNKVFTPAEHAEKMAWSLLNYYRSKWEDFKKAYTDTLGTSAACGDDFVKHIDQNTVLSRTYLTYGWKYKARMLKNCIGSDFKKILLYQEFPRFVWVTEFGTLPSLNHLNFKQRRVFGHAVIDATGSKHWGSACMFHAPGAGYRFIPNDADIFGGYQMAFTPITDDRGYFPKLRSEDNFESYTI